MTCFDKLGNFIVYSDCKDTQVFFFDADTLLIQKLTKKISQVNGLQSLPPAIAIKVYAEDGLTKALIID
jgi:hypothetical protein